MLIIDYQKLIVLSRLRGLNMNSIFYLGKFDVYIDFTPGEIRNILLKNNLQLDKDYLYIDINKKGYCLISPKMIFSWL